jgi:hypothetical protein
MPRREMVRQAHRPEPSRRTGVRSPEDLRRTHESHEQCGLPALIIETGESARAEWFIPASRFELE